ncbi:hypothetical protein T492DRAFT_976120 [Pavlovales sp. CCMP2436]|nr:hypothetical protein T492DRAFT_976120 [Pavlovales sp. CCMP2436]
MKNAGGAGRGGAGGADEEGGSALRSEEEEAFLRANAGVKSLGGETEEEVAAYLAARKRSFPTAANVAQREKELAEAMARGELPKLQAGKRGRAQDVGTDGGGKRPARRVCTYFASSRGCRNGARCKFLHEPALPRGTPPIPAGPPPPTAAAQSGAHGGLAGLMQAYGGASDDDDVPDESTDAPPLANGATATMATVQPEGDGGSGSGPSSAPAQPWKPPRAKPPSAAPASSKKNGSLLQKSLLQKLLAKEIRGEKSLILQCIRHITAHDYLQVAENQ